MPPDISIRRFKGLVTYSPNADGEVDELVSAENVLFDDNGQATARPGFHFFTNTPVGEFLLYFLGRTGDADGDRLLASFQSYYLWRGSHDNPALSRTGIISVLSGSRTSNVVTLTIDTPNGHGLAVNDRVTVTVADITYNGTFTVASVLTGPHRITYAQTAADDAASGTGTVLTVPNNLFDVGVQYNFNLYLIDGRHWDGLLDIIKRTTGQPTALEGCMAVHAERLWFVDRGAGNARLRFSDPGNPDSWPAANFIDIQPGDGTLATDLRSFQNRLYIFKERDSWVLETPGTPTTWLLRRFSNIGGSVRSSVEYDGVMYWHAATGAYRFDGSGIDDISDPINNIFKVRTVRDTVSFGASVLDTLAFRDLWIFGFYVKNTLRFFCFHTKLELWSEWTFPSFIKVDTSNELGIVDGPLSIWAEPYNEFTLNAGIYMTVKDLTNHAFLVGTELSFTDSYVDETGSHIGVPVEIEHDYEVKIQTKYSEFGDPYGKKRSLDWILEHEGGDVLVEQISSDQVIVDRTVLGSTAIGVVNQNKISGLGYFRKLSLRLTASNFKSTGFRFYGLYGRMKSRGKQITNQEQVVS